MRIKVSPGGPAGRPLIGHLLAFRRDRLNLLDACVAAPGDVIELRIRAPAYLLKRAEDVQHVLVTGQSAYVKDPRNIGARATRIFGDGLMTGSGEAHRRMRQRVQPVFKRESMAQLAGAAVQGVDEMVGRWDGAGEIDLADEMTRLALGILIGSIFGVHSRPELTALANGVVARRDSMTRGLSSLIPLPASLPLALRPRRRRQIKRFDEVVEGLIEARRQRDLRNGDVLSMVMSVHQGGRSSADPRQVRDQVLTFILAGYENIARVLTWTLQALARHTDVQAKLNAGVHRVLGDRAPEVSDLPNLRYTEMTIAESMRLWPPNALITRVARRDDVLPSGTRIAAGSKLLLSPYVVHRDPSYYPDPERFAPERFDEAEGGRRPRYAYFPFGGGPRICIGQTLAIMTCTLALARMAQLARLELSGNSVGYECGCLPAGFGPQMRVGRPA
jgi:cytochrome P450